MANHLPECACTCDDDKCGYVCICADLRACEQRAYRLGYRDAHVTDSEESVRLFSAGVAAARDAVVALRDENRQGTDPEWGVLNSAISAIDAVDMNVSSESWQDRTNRESLAALESRMQGEQA